jgi:hypothetical protein
MDTSRSRTVVSGIVRLGNGETNPDYSVRRLVKISLAFRPERSRFKAYVHALTKTIAGRSGATGRPAQQDCYQASETLCHGTSFAISSPLSESALAGRASAIIRRLGLFFSSSRVEFGAFYDVALSAFVSVLARQ